MINSPLTIEQIKDLAKEFDLVYEFDEVYKLPILHNKKITLKATITDGKTYNGWHEVYPTSLRTYLTDNGLKPKL